MGIQINGNTNNINAGIGSLSIEDLNELDIVGVATASNFKTGVSNLHSVGLTLSGGQLDVGSNIKIGNAGVVTATTFSGSGASLTNLNASNIASGTVPTARLGSGTASSSTFLAGDSTFKTVTGTTINNNADNRIITGSGTANTLEGEANFTFSGSKAIMKHGATTTVSDRGLMLQASSNLSAGDVLPGITLNPNTNVDRPRAGIAGVSNGGTSGMDLIFMTRYAADGSQLTSSDERLRITSAGQMVMGATTSKAKFEIKDNGYSSSTVLQRISGDDANPYALIIANDTCNTAAASGLQFFVSDTGEHYVRARASSTAGNNNLRLSAQNNVLLYSGSSETERLRITSGGELWVGTTSGVSNGGYGGISLNGNSGSLLSLMQNGTEYLRLFGDSNPAIQFAGVLRLFSGVSGGSAIWGISPNGTTTGANSVTFNLKSTIQHTVGVMAVSSSYNSGDLYIRIDNIYNLAGNAWWTFGLWIMSNQVVGTLAGHHSYMIHCVMTGLGSWSSVSANNIQGSGAAYVSVSQHGTNFVELKVDVHDSSRGPCTVLCNGGTFDPPRISFH